MSAAEELPPPTATPWLTYEGAAEYVSLAVATLHGMVSAREIPFYGTRRCRRFRRDMLDLWLVDRGFALRKWEQELKKPW